MGKTYKTNNEWGKSPKRRKAEGVVRPQPLQDQDTKEKVKNTQDWWEDYYPDEDDNFEKFNRRK